jgi:hypothetical protein
MPKAKKILYLSLIEVSTPSKTPTYKLWVNGDEIVPVPVAVQQVDQDRKRIDFEIPVDYLDTVQLELLNKGPTDTKVVDGKITEDLMVIIENLTVDCINLTNQISKISVYKDLHGQVHKTYGYLAFNGTMIIKIHKNILYTNWLSTVF